jgi:hypothetical protein
MAGNRDLPQVKQFYLLSSRDIQDLAKSQFVLSVIPPRLRERRARRIYQNATHHLRRDAKESRRAVPARLLRRCPKRSTAS